MARRTRTLTPPDELVQASHTFLYNRDVASTATRTKDRARDLLKGWLTMKDALGRFVNGRTDENGHRYYDLEPAITINDQTYTAIVAQRKTSSYIDVDAVEALLKSKDDQSYDVVFPAKVVREFDEDALYGLHQKGVITDEEMDALTIEEESYSLTSVKA